MPHKSTSQIFEELLVRYAALSACRDDIHEAYELLRGCFESGGKLLLCGNGGSCADCGHIVGELMKGFLLKRPLSAGMKDALRKAGAAYDASSPGRVDGIGSVDGMDPANGIGSTVGIGSAGFRHMGEALADGLQGALAAVNLCEQSALNTAVANDMGADLMFAQQTLALGRGGDALLAISTSGNAENVCRALLAARAAGMRTIGLTGAGGGRMAPLCDVAVRVPAILTHEVQEYHLPVYHALCAMLEAHFFD